LKAAVQSGLQRVLTVTGTRHIFPKLALVRDEDTDATLFNLLDPRARPFIAFFTVVGALASSCLPIPAKAGIGLRMAALGYLVNGFSIIVSVLLLMGVVSQDLQVCFVNS
jgi:hypothetical protein